MATNAWIEEGFGEFDVPAALTNHPLLADTSWHHNACPSFETGEPVNGKMYKIWVDAADSEVAGIREKHEGRYMVCSLHLDSGCCDEAVMITDDLDAVLALLTPKQEN